MDNIFVNRELIAAIITDVSTKTSNLEYLSSKYKLQKDIINSIIADNMLSKKLTDRTVIITLPSLMNVDESEINC